MRHRLREALGIVGDLAGVIGVIILIWGALGKQLQRLLAQLPASNVPLVVLGALLIGVDIVVRLAYPRSSQSPPRTQQTPAAPRPTPAFAPEDPAPAAPGPGPRIIVDRTPEELTANFKGVTLVQGEDRVKRYLGNWLRVSGPVGNVALITPEIVRATFGDRTIFTWNVVNMLFRDKQWNDRLVQMNPGDQLTVVGQIIRVDQQNVDLDNCEIESSAGSRDGTRVK